MKQTRKPTTNYQLQKIPHRTGSNLTGRPQGNLAIYPKFNESLKSMISVKAIQMVVNTDRKTLVRVTINYPIHKKRGETYSNLSILSSYLDGGYL